MKSTQKSWKASVGARVWLCAGVIAALAALPALAQTAGGGKPPPADVEKLHDELRALKATMERALNANDIDAIVANVTDDVVFTTMNGDVARGPAAIRKYFETMMKGDNPRVRKVTAAFEAEDLSNLYGPDFAVAFGSSKDQYELAGGENFAVAARWSATMVRRDGRWRIANFHYSTNMFDNPILRAQRKYLLGAAAAAGIVLAIVGFWAGRRTARRAMA